MGDICRHHVEETGMVTNGGCVDASRARDMMEWKLTYACQAMSDLLPVDQIKAMKDRDARKEFKATCNHVVILSYAADTGVGIEAG
jgi:hypothetical protein